MTDHQRDDITDSTAMPPGPGGGWFLAVNKERQGPLDAQALAALARQGQLTESSRLWKKGMPGWERTQQLPAIAHLLTAVRLALAREREHEARWFYADKPAGQGKSQPSGPLSDVQLAELLLEGRLTDRTRVWRKGQSEWLALGLVAELDEVRERARRALVQDMPPLDEDDLVPPTISLDEIIPVSWARALSPAAPLPPPLPAPAARAPVPMQAARAAEPPRATRTAPAVVGQFPVFANVHINEERVAPLRALFERLKALHAGRPDIVRRLVTLEQLTARDFMVGNAHGLDKQLEAIAVLASEPAPD